MKEYGLYEHQTGQRLAVFQNASGHQLITDAMPEMSSIIDGT